MSFSATLPIRRTKSPGSNSEPKVLHEVDHSDEALLDRLVKAGRSRLFRRLRLRSFPASAHPDGKVSANGLLKNAGTSILVVTRAKQLAVWIATVTSADHVLGLD